MIDKLATSSKNVPSSMQKKKKKKKKKKTYTDHNPAHAQSIYLTFAFRSYILYEWFCWRTVKVCAEDTFLYDAVPLFCFVF